MTETQTTPKKWEELSANALEGMKFLGNFSPTYSPRVKGYMIDDEGDAGKVYLTPTDQRDLASACNEVADWLEERGEGIP